MEDTKLNDAPKYVEDVLCLMASQGSQISKTMELLGMEKKKKRKLDKLIRIVLDKLTRIGVAHSTSMSIKQCDIRSFFVSTWSQWHIMMCYLCYASFWIWLHI